MYRSPRDLHVLTLSFPTLRSSDLQRFPYATRRWHPPRGPPPAVPPPCRRLHETAPAPPRCSAAAHQHRSDRYPPTPPPAPPHGTARPNPDSASPAVPPAPG